MAEEDVIDKNREIKNFRRTNTFHKNEPILLATFGYVKKYLGKFMFAPQNCFGFLWLGCALSISGNFKENNRLDSNLVIVVVSQCHLAKRSNDDETFLSTFFIAFREFAILIRICSCRNVFFFLFLMFCR